MENGVGALMMASRLDEWLDDLQLLELLDLLSQRHLDAHETDFETASPVQEHPLSD